MPKKRTGLPGLKAIVEEDQDGGLTVTLPEPVRGSLPIMRALYHRVVDVIADHAMLEWLVYDVETRMAALSDQIVSDFVTDLIREAHAPRKEVDHA